MVVRRQEEDPAALTAAVEAVLDQPGLRERLSAGAYRLARERLSWDNTLRRLLEVLF